MHSKRGFVYFLSNAKHGVIYIGVTSDIVRRIYQHKEGFIKGFSQKYKLKKLVYYEIHESIEEAIAAEKKLKNLHRDKKIIIIERQNPDWSDLYDEIIL